MARRPKSPAPQFGDWESEANLSYTDYFEKQNKNNNGAKKNLNDRRENPSPLNGPTKNRPKHQRHMSHEDNEINGSQTSPLNDQVGAIAPMHEAEAQRSNGQDSVKSKHDHPKDVGDESSPRRGLKQSADRSFERSPLHQSKFGNKASGSSPSSERKGSSEAAGNRSFAPSTPTRSRLSSVRGDESPDHGTAVPKFGDWDESNPASAVGYTQLFEKVREERLENEAGGGPATGTPRTYLSGHRQHNKDSSKRCGCFPW